MSDEPEFKKRLPLKAGDIVIIAVVLAAAGMMSAFYAFGGEKQTSGAFAVVISPSGRYEYPLAADAVFTVHGSGHTLTAVIEDGEIYVADSDCPDGICVHMGRVSHPGEMIVCLPAKVLITVTGTGAEDGFDAVAG